MLYYSRSLSVLPHMWSAMSVEGFGLESECLGMPRSSRCYSYSYRQTVSVLVRVTPVLVRVLVHHPSDHHAVNTEYGTVPYSVLYYRQI